MMTIAKIPQNGIEGGEDKALAIKYALIKSDERRKLMSISKDPIVIEMPRTFVSPDGSFVEMELRNSDGSSQILRFSPDTMMRFLGNVFELFLNQKIQMESKAGYYVVQPLRAVATSAQQDIDDQVVILQFRLKNGLPVAFSILPSEAAELHRQIGEALINIQKQSSKRLH